jgi:hypothetical protein
VNDWSAVGKGCVGASVRAWPGEAVVDLHVPGQVRGRSWYASERESC